MADLSIVASLLKDTNKKLDKLHSDNEQDDTKADIIKNALPEILSDTLNTQRQIAQWEEEKKRDEATDTLIKKEDEKAAKREETTQKLIGDIKEPLKTLGLAIPKSGFNAFSEKASDISAEKSLPSDFKLMLQALTPKALTQGFKVGLGDMFKELGGGIKKIGSGMKSLATKGLTAAQRKSEEKEKESKEKRRDGFFKNQFGKITGFLGGILKTAKLAGKAGFLALLGAGAIYALAKLIESPYWNTVAGIIESGFKRIRSLFEFMDEQFGVGGVIATALALYYGPRAATTLAGMGIRALAKKLFFKGATDTLAGSAGQAATSLGSKASKLGLLGRLGLLGGGLTAAALAMYGLSVAIDWFHDRSAKAETKILNDAIKDIDKQTPAEQQRRKEVVDEIARKRSQQRADDPRAREQLRKANEAQRIIADAVKKRLEQKPPVDAAVYGGSPAEIRAIIAKSFKEAISATHFEGSAENRLGQLKELFGGVSSKLLGKEFQALDAEKKSAFLKLLRLEEQSAFQSIRSGGKSKFSGQSSSTAFRAGIDKKDERELMLGFQDVRKSLINLRKSQIKDPSSILPELNDELRNNTEQLKTLNDTPRGSDTTVVNSTSVGGNHNSVTIPPQVPMYARFPNGGIHHYGEVY